MAHRPAPRRLAPAAAVALVASLLVVGPAAAHACASHPPKVRLSGFANGPQDLPPYYWGIESQSQVGFELNVFGHDCSGDETSVKWSTINGTALAGEDFQGVSNKLVELPGLSADGEEQFVEQFVSLLSGGTEPEDAVESFTLKLTESHPGALSHTDPIEAPVHLVNDDGSLRVGLPAGVSPTIKELDGHFATNPDVQIPVFRAGSSTSTSVVVNYSITPTADDGFTDLTSGSVTIPIGQRHATIQLGINRDDDGTDENLNITLTSASGGATLAENTTATVNIDDNYFPGSDTTPPATSFHHPKHGVTYKFGSAKARTIHVYAPGVNVEPSGIQFAQTALKRVKKSGSCQWWDDPGWVGGSCADTARHTHWLPTEFIGTLNAKRIYEYFLTQNLKPSFGTEIKFYFVYSRAQDKAGNLESQLELGRNKNKFEIKKF